MCAAGNAGALWDAVDAGDTVSVRLKGMELTNGFTRWSAAQNVTVAAEAVYGGTRHVNVPFTTRTLELSKGDMLELDRDDDGPALRHRPGLLDRLGADGLRLRRRARHHGQAPPLHHRRHLHGDGHDRRAPR